MTISWINAFQYHILENISKKETPVTITFFLDP